MNKYQEALENIKDDIHLIKTTKDIETLQELIDKFEAIEKADNENWRIR